eukprot:CAMPEP_0202021278 /NCGR_PEP_ID=MMETSP0905-20130828/46522_1 /ASSEMBLY_ACC=CAM_ASM_000554 /TAXON_ID=420261 /ORGANISM="Thalassiosira antarctica, Strain CCMP982" /LENGTH=343 /DNA_ID=CAMNT_0048583103 /DNA_START=108 /DNA_END=1136 /DNA_ORIENTATION=-
MVCIIGALVFIIIWTVALIWTASTLEETQSAIHHAKQQDEINPQNTSSKNNEDDIAKEIPGIELQISSPVSNEDPIQIVYTNNTTTAIITSSKGLVLLLHACSHSALKFFSPSPSTCPNCVGLSEELRIVRLVIEQGYTPVAVSSINRQNGCWSTRDVPRIEAVLKHDLFQKYQHDGKGIFGIGASSGGAFAAELATRKIVQGALVMVMQLSSDVVNKLRTSPVPIYLAPMPRDKNVMKHVMKNYRDLDSVKEFIILDRTTCDSLPVTTNYLIQRVPGMTVKAAEELISKLKQAEHIDSFSNMLHVDPTRSEWRTIISTNKSTHWLNKFDLKPGYSPLAKALH